MQTQELATGGKPSLMDKLAAQTAQTKKQNETVKTGNLEKTIEEVNAANKIETETIHEAVLNGELNNLTEDDMQKMQDAAEIKRKAEADAIIKANQADELAENKLMQEKAAKAKELAQEITFALRTGSSLKIPFRFGEHDLEIVFENGIKTLKGKLAQAFNLEYNKNASIKRLIKRLDHQIEESSELTERYRRSIANQNKFAQGAEAAKAGQLLPPVAQNAHALKTIQQQLTSQNSGVDVIDDPADMPLR